MPVLSWQCRQLVAGRTRGNPGHAGCDDCYQGQARCEDCDRHNLCI